MFDWLCPPAILYIAFSLTQIIIDLYRGYYNTSLLKFIIMIILTIALNMLCKSGLEVVSWIIVFIPFISLTIITSLLLFVLGLSPVKGLNYSVDYPKNDTVIVTADGINQPYEDGTSVSPGAYRGSNIIEGLNNKLPETSLRTNTNNTNNNLYKQSNIISRRQNNNSGSYLFNRKYKYPFIRRPYPPPPGALKRICDYHLNKPKNIIPDVNINIDSIVLDTSKLPNLVTTSNKAKTQSKLPIISKPKPPIISKSKLPIISKPKPPIISKSKLPIISKPKPPIISKSKLPIILSSKFKSNYSNNMGSGMSNGVFGNDISDSIGGINNGLMSSGVSENSIDGNGNYNYGENASLSEIESEDEAGNYTQDYNTNSGTNNKYTLYNPLDNPSGIITNYADWNLYGNKQPTGRGYVSSPTPYSGQGGRWLYPRSSGSNQPPLSAFPGQINN